MTTSQTFSSMKNFLFVFVAVCLLASCQEDEMLSVSENAKMNMVAAGAIESNVASLTIMSENTEFVSSLDCNTCTFIVAGNSETIDGKALGLKPGSVICLDAAVTYGSLTFINLQGTKEAPITIGNCNASGK